MSDLKSLLLFLLVFLAASCSREINSQSTLRLNPACEEIVRHLNQGLTVSLIRDIKRVAGSTQTIPPELKILYPAARDQWNSALSTIELNYSDTWAGIPVASYDGPLPSWREAPLQDYQKFFLLLAELRFGRFDQQPQDPERAAALKESYEMSRRINVRLKALRDNCYGSEDENVRANLKLMKLPGNIEECLEL